MKTVELAPGVFSTILGFGCAPILGAVGSREAERALHAAIDHGVRHLDLARSYGYGEAEAFVGRFLKGKRDGVVIATKFGIEATWMARALAPVKPMVRALKSPRGAPNSPASPPKSPAEESSGSNRRDPFHRRIPITAANLRKNLEKSLKALGTDHVDLYLIHEPLAAIDGIEELARAASLAKQQGKIRAWGAAVNWQQRGVVAPFLDSLDVLQFDSSPASPHYHECLNLRRRSPNVIFSPIRHRGSNSPEETLQTLWADFPESVVLCSMYSLKHIKKNCELAESISEGSPTQSPGNPNPP